MVRLHDGAERIPLTIADFDADAGTVTVVVQALGRIDRRDARPVPRGRHVRRLRRARWACPPRSSPATGRRRHVVLVGGGLGVAPVFPQLRAFKQAGNRTTAIVGFRSAELELLAATSSASGPTS